MSERKEREKGERKERERREKGERKERERRERKERERGKRGERLILDGVTLASNGNNLKSTACIV